MTINTQKKYTDTKKKLLKKPKKGTKEIGGPQGPNRLVMATGKRKVDV